MLDSATTQRYAELSGGDPATGLFTSVDPIHGGTASAYTYPTDAVNRSDISGLREAPDRGSGSNNWLFAVEGVLRVGASVAG